MAASIVFDMLASTAPVLFVIPAFHAILGDSGGVTPTPRRSSSRFR